MATCFVIQPFDHGKFDKRYSDVYKPSILAAGMEPYRVDQDPGVLIPIEAIEKGIRSAAICLADITSDSPNVWYELGFASAARRPVIMVCSQERIGRPYPFDIQHRSILSYATESSSDFDALKSKITDKILALLKQDSVLDTIAEQDPVSTVHGLSQFEVRVLAVVAGDLVLPEQVALLSSVRRSAEYQGLTSMGFIVAVRRLLSKRFIQEQDLRDERDGEVVRGLAITELGWAWIDANESEFVLHRPEWKSGFDEVPF